MELTRRVREREVETRTVLCDSGTLDVWWDFDKQDGGEYHPGEAVVTVDAPPEGGGEAYCYMVRLKEKELGQVLSNVPLEAVPLVLDGLLRGRDPEVLGAVVGRIISHIAQLAMRAASQSAGVASRG